MAGCVNCESAASIERVTVLASTDGPVLLTRWRCDTDATHWWDAGSDAAPSAWEAADDFRAPVRMSPAR
jgi:hypothetical protein